MEKGTKHSLTLTADWILNSGIQSKDGGFYAWYDKEKDAYPYIYSEITGYGITTLLFLNSILAEKKCVEKAESAAKWIIDSAIHKCGGVRTRLYTDKKETDKVYSFEGERIFSFDTGMVLFGMASLSGLTGKSEFLGASVKLANFLIDKMQNKDGSFAPVYDAKAGKVIESDDKWSNQTSGFHSKIAMGLSKLYKITGDERFKRSAIAICEYAMSTQDEYGRFITDRNKGTTHIHPHSYSAEGLFMAGRALNIPSFIKSAQKGAEWAFGKVKSSGINEVYDPSSDRFNDFQRSDILAQVLRLGLIFSLEDKVEILKSKLLEHQVVEGAVREKGGFLYNKNGKDINSWCTMFALQAMALGDQKGLLEESREILLI